MVLAVRGGDTVAIERDFAARVVRFAVGLSTCVALTLTASSAGVAAGRGEVVSVSGTDNHYWLFPAATTRACFAPRKSEACGEPRCLDTIECDCRVAPT